MLNKSLNRRVLIKGAAAAGVAAGAAGMALPAVRPAGAQDETLKIAFSVPGLNFPFFVHMMNLAEQHAAELGGIEFIPLDGQQGGAPSSTKQTADLEAATAQGINGLVISPNDAAALAPAIQAVTAMLPMSPRWRMLVLTMSRAAVCRAAICSRSCRMVAMSTSCRGNRARRRPSTAMPVSKR
jgi:hypothetical protein